MLDVMEVAKSFNSKIGDANFNSKVDLNSDLAVNMADILIIAKNFNKSSTDYTKIEF